MTPTPRLEHSWTGKPLQHCRRRPGSGKSPPEGAQTIVPPHRLPLLVFRGHVVSPRGTVLRRHMDNDPRGLTDDRRSPVPGGYESGDSHKPAVPGEEGLGCRPVDKVPDLMSEHGNLVPQSQPLGLAGAWVPRAMGEGSHHGVSAQGIVGALAGLHSCCERKGRECSHRRNSWQWPRTRWWSWASTPSAT
jgi:hypothetical protein